MEGLGFKKVMGALVVEVKKNGVADKLGIKPGNVIIEFAGQPIKNSRKLQLLVAQTSVDQIVKIVLIRNGINQVLSGKITEEDSEQPKMMSEEIIAKN